MQGLNGDLPTDPHIAAKAFVLYLNSRALARKLGKIKGVAETSEVKEEDLTPRWRRTNARSCVYR